MLNWCRRRLKIVCDHEMIETQEVHQFKVSRRLKVSEKRRYFTTPTKDEAIQTLDSGKSLQTHESCTNSPLA